MGSSLDVSADKKTRKVRIRERYWDGFDRPEYTLLSAMDPDSARHLGQQLLHYAEVIDGKSKKDRTGRKVRKAVDAIIKEARAADDVPGAYA